jgi:hypothetical protein
MVKKTDEVVGRAKGGFARAEKLSPERRSEIARKAAEVRYGGSLLKATHKGNFKDDFGFDIECYVLADEAKTAVISQRGMGVALGLGEGGSRLPSFVSGKTLSRYLSHELKEKLNSPLIFQSSNSRKDSSAILHGYDVTILIDLCKAVITAENDRALLASQMNVAKQAHVIVNASAKAGIKGLVYALAGYDATKEEAINAFKFYIRQEAREYEKEFPEMLYAEWYRLYNLPKPERNKPWKFKDLTLKHVYQPLAKSSGRVLKLTQDQRKASQERGKKLHQFLSDVGVKALRTHLGQLLGIARISKSEADYESHFDTLFGSQENLFKSK